MNKKRALDIFISHCTSKKDFVKISKKSVKIFRGTHEFKIKLKKAREYGKMLEKMSGAENFDKVVSHLQAANLYSHLFELKTGYYLAEESTRYKVSFYPEVLVKGKTRIPDILLTLDSSRQLYIECKTLVGSTCIYCGSGINEEGRVRKVIKRAKAQLPVDHTVAIFVNIKASLFTRKVVKSYLSGNNRLAAIVCLSGNDIHYYFNKRNEELVQSILIGESKKG